MGRPRNSTNKFSAKSAEVYFGPRVRAVYDERLKSKNAQTRYAAARELLPYTHQKQPESLEHTGSINVNVDYSKLSLDNLALIRQHPERISELVERN